LRGRKTVRADHRLRTDEKHIRAQSAILYNPIALRLMLTRTVFLCGCAFYPRGKHGWRAQRATSLVACDDI